MVPPSDDSSKSLGDGATGSDVEPSEPSSPQSVGDQPTTGDMGSSISDLVDIGEDFGDGSEEIVDLEARYEIQETLGIGGMGEVVLAHDMRLNRQVAIKRLRNELIRSRRAKQRFLTEAQSVARLSHNNIVQIYDYGHATDGPFIVGEFVSGGSLDERLQGQALELFESVELISQVCDGLQKAHDEGIIHRDIKPANILMTTEGVPKLTDFGLARQETVDGTGTQAGVVLGTLDYMPGEQKNDASTADARSDQWSLAATLYQMTTGESPRVIDLEEVPETIRSVLQQALKTNPDSRFASVSVFGQALRDTLLGPVSATTHGLNQGQCPNSACGMVNQTDRKFCKECGESLREPCLKCEVPIGPWEKFCPDCGGNLDELATALREELEGTRERVGDLRRDCRFEEALQFAATLGEQTHSRLRNFAEWSSRAIEEIATEKQKRETERDERLAEARRLVEADELEDAVRVIEQVPVALRNPELVQLESLIERRNSELVARMKALVEEAEVRKSLLEKQHAEGDYIAAVATGGGLSDFAAKHPSELSDYGSWVEAQLETLGSELAGWEQKRATWLVEAQSLLEADEYSSTLELLAQLPKSMRSEAGDGAAETVAAARMVEQAEEGLSNDRKRDALRERIEHLQKRVPKLRGEYRHAEAIEALEELSGINEQKLTNKIAWVNQQLGVIREEYQELLETQNRLRNAARESLEQHKFDEAIRLLNQIPEPIRDADSAGFLENALGLVQRARQLRATIKIHVDRKNYGLLPDLITRYLEIKGDDVGVVRLRDKLEERDRRRAQRTLEKHNERERAAQQRSEVLSVQRLIKRINKGFAADSLDVDLLSDLMVEYEQVVPNDEYAETLDLGELTYLSENRVRILRRLLSSYSRRLNIVVLLGLLAFLFGCLLPVPAAMFLDSAGVGSWVSVIWFYVVTVASIAALCRGLWMWYDLWEHRIAVPTSIKRTVKFSGLFLTVLILPFIALQGVPLPSHGIKDAISERPLPPNTPKKTLAQRPTAKTPAGTPKVGGSTTVARPLAVHSSGSVNSVSFSPDGKWIVSGSDEVKVCDAQTGRETLIGQGHSGDVTCVRFSPDGKRIVSGSDDKTVKVWDTQTGQETLTLKGHSGFVRSVSFSPDGKRIVSSGGGDFGLTGEVKMWDAQTGKEMFTLQGHSCDVTCVRFSPDGKRIVSGGGEYRKFGKPGKPGEIKVWDAQTGQVTLTLEGHSGAVSSVAVSPDGKRIVSGSYDKTVKVWDAQTGRETLILQGHSGRVLSVSFSPDSKRIVSSSSKTVKNWDAKTGQELAILVVNPSVADLYQESVRGVIPNRFVRCVSFSPDGKRIVSGDARGAVHAWGLEFERPPSRRKPLAPPGATGKTKKNLKRRPSATTPAVTPNVGDSAKVTQTFWGTQLPSLA